MIGTLTWYHNSNYGGSLQAMALRWYIEKLGYRTENINFKPQRERLDWGRFFVKQHHSRLPAFLARILEFVIPVFINGCFIQSVLRGRNQQRFVDEHMVESPCRFATPREIEESGRYSLVVVGSDQIWKPKYIGDKGDYLLKGAGRRLRRIAYAPSIADQSLGDVEQMYQENLPLFDAVSLREKDFVEEFSFYTRRPVLWAVDPTLLHNADEWKSALGLKSRKGRYLMVYWLSDFENMLPWLEQYVRTSRIHAYVYMNLRSLAIEHWSLGSILRHLRLRWRIFKNCRIHVRKFPGPIGFLNSLLGAEHILSDSFHALMFSSIFEKDAKIYIPKERQEMGCRITDFVERVGWKDVVVDSLDSNVFAHQSGCASGSRDSLNRWISESSDWLNSSIKSAIGREGCVIQ